MLLGPLRSVTHHLSTWIRNWSRLLTKSARLRDWSRNWKELTTRWSSSQWVAAHANLIKQVVTLMQMWPLLPTHLVQIVKCSRVSNQMAPLAWRLTTTIIITRSQSLTATPSRQLQALLNPSPQTLPKAQRLALELSIQMKSLRKTWLLRCPHRKVLHFRRTDLACYPN